MKWWFCPGRQVNEIGLTGPGTIAKMTLTNHVESAGETDYLKNIAKSMTASEEELQKIRDEHPKKVKNLTDEKTASALFGI